MVINSLLKDSQQQWTRRRESITNIRMQAKLGATNLNNHLPWREVHDPNEAVSIASEFLYGAVEPVAGSERGTFRGVWATLHRGHGDALGGHALVAATPLVARQLPRVVSCRVVSCRVVSCSAACLSFSYIPG